MVNTSPEISASQLRAARAWLDWTQDFLASKAGVSKRAVVRAEAGSSLQHKKTAERLRMALERAGLKFRFDKMKGVGIEIGDADLEDAALGGDGRGRHDQSGQQ